PGRVNMATPGTGTSPHVSGELFKMMTGVNMVHVPYRGAAPALTDLIGGQVQVMFDNLPSSVEHIKSGKIRALGVTTARRADADGAGRLRQACCSRHREMGQGSAVRRHQTGVAAVMTARRLFVLGLFGLLLAGGDAVRAADPYPTRPIRWVVGFVPGGATD